MDEGPLRREATSDHWQLRFHTQTAGVSLTAQQPENNIAAPRSRRSPACSAAPSRCTPTPWTRRWRCPQRRRRAWPCAPSRSSPTRPTSRTSPTPWAARGTSRSSPTRWSGAPRRSSPRSSRWATGSMLEGCIRGIEENWFQGRIADSAYELERMLQRRRAHRRGGQRLHRGQRRGRARDPAHHQRGRAPTAGAARTRCDATRDDAVARAPWSASRRDAADPEVNLMPAPHRVRQGLRDGRRDDVDAWPGSSGATWRCRRCDRAGPGRQGGPGRTRPRHQGRRAPAARRRHGGRLHRASSRRPSRSRRRRWTRTWTSWGSRCCPARTSHWRRWSSWRYASAGSEIPVVVGGIVPPDDVGELRAAGVAAVFGPGARAEDIVAAVSALVPAD